MHKIVVSSLDGTLSDTAEIFVFAPATPPRLMESPASASADDGVVTATVGAPPLNPICSTVTPDYLEIDRGSLFMVVLTKRQIRVRGCLRGRPLSAARLYVNSTSGTATESLQFEAGPVPWLVTLRVGDTKSASSATASLVLIPNLLECGIIALVLKRCRSALAKWRQRRRRRNRRKRR
jgi:hypothetical protein